MRRERWIIPVSEGLRHYRRVTLRWDLLAGLTVTALALPSGDPEHRASLAPPALLVGGVFGLARLIRLGWIAACFSRAVLTEYIHRVAVVLVIAAQAIPHLEARDGSVSR